MAHVVRGQRKAFGMKGVTRWTLSKKKWSSSAGVTAIAARILHGQTGFRTDTSLAVTRSMTRGDREAQTRNKHPARSFLSIELALHWGRNGVGSRFRATNHHMESGFSENDSRPL